jgi:hypothetical protein
MLACKVLDLDDAIYSLGNGHLEASLLRWNGNNALSDARERWCVYVPSRRLSPPCSCHPILE